MTARPSSPRRRAVVIGASVAGLLCAAAVSRHFDEVHVVDRDRRPRGLSARGGVPHARHSHILLHPGCVAVEALLPGAMAGLQAAGAAYGPASSRLVIHLGGGPIDLRTTDLAVLALGREALEGELRRQTQTLPGITFHWRTSVLDVRLDGGRRVVGVRATSLDDGQIADLEADLVVDASGRTSHIVDTLAGYGIPAPPVDRVRVDGWYVTRRFTLSPGRARPEALGELATIIQTTPGVLRRTAVLCRVDSRTWSVSMAGYGGERAPAELPGFRDFAQELSGPIVPVLADLVPDGDPVVFRLPNLVRRRFDRLDDPPAGLVVVGDAVCTVDAAGGIGMSLAAVQALALREALEAVPLRKVPREAYRRSAGTLDLAWRGALSRHVPATGDGVVIDRHVRQVLAAAEHDPVLGLAFSRVAHLQAEPHTLLAPPLAQRALAAAPSA